MKQVSWFKRYLALAMTLFLMLSLIPMQIFAAEDGALRDMPSKSYWAYDALNSAVENDILRGNDGKLNPRGLVTRGQLAAILNRVFGAVEMADISVFTDIPAGYALKNDLAKALQMKTMQGNGTLMNPTGNVTRQQAFTMIARALKLEDGALAVLDSFSDKDQIASYARGPLAAMVSAGYVSGSNGKLNPKSMVSREQVAQVLYNIFAKYIRAAGTYSGEQVGNVIVNVPGVTFKDATITGDLILGEGLADGEVTLDNTIVQGRLVVRGGGANSIRIINNSNVGSIIVSKTASGGVRVLCSEGARVEMVYVNDGVDEVNLEGSFKSVKVGSEVGVALTNANVTELNIEAANADVEVRSGSVSNVTLAESAANADLALDKGTSVGKLTIASDAAADVTVAGKVANVTVERGSNTAAQTTLNIENTAKVNTVNVEAGAATNIDAAKGANIGTVKAEDKSDVSGSGANNTNKGNGGGNSSGNGGNNNPPQNPTTSVSTQSALLAALEDDTVQAITVSGSITMSEAWLYVEKDLTIARGAALTADHLSVYNESTLTNNGTLATKAHGLIEINRDCTLTNAGTMNVGEDVGITVRGTLENTSNNGFTLGKNACITAYAGAVVNGISGTVFAGNDGDTYLADGSFVSGDQSKDIQADGQAQLVATSSNLSAYVYGTTGLQNALAAAEASTSAKPMYSGLFLCADEDTSNNTIQLDGKHAMDSIVYVYEGVTLNIGSGAELTARALNWYGTVNIDSNGVLTVNYADGSGTLVNEGTLKSGSIYAYGNALLDNSAGTLEVDSVRLRDNVTATGMAGQELNINSWAYDYYYPDADDDEMSADPGVTVDGVSQINGRIACVYGSEALQRVLASGINYDEIDLQSDGTSATSSVLIDSELTVKCLHVGNDVTLTIADGVTLTVKDLLDINGSLVNNGTLNVEQAYVHVYGTLDNRSGSILFTEETKQDSGTYLYVAQDGSALGLPAITVNIEGNYDTYFENGSVQSNEGDAAVITGAARIVKSNSTAHIYGKAGYDSFAAAGKSYQEIYFYAGEQSNQIHLTSSLTADYINVRNGADLTIPQNVSLTVNEQLDIYGASLTVANGSFLTIGSLYVNDGGALNNKGTVTCDRYFHVGDGSYWDEDEQRYVEGLPTGVINEGRMSIGVTNTSVRSWVSGANAFLTQDENAYLAFYGSLGLYEGATLTVNSDVITTTQSETGFYIVPGYRIYIYDYLYPGNVSLVATVSGAKGIAQQKSMYVMTYSEKMLREALKNDSYGAYDSVNIRYYADELTITEDLTIDRYVSFAYYDSELNILDGATLTVKTGILDPASLSVAAGGELVLDGTQLGYERLNFKNAGTVVINEDGRLRCGSYKNTGSIENNGSIVVQPTLSVHDTYTTPAQGTMTGTGRFEVRPYCETETEAEFWEAQENGIDYYRVNYYGDLTVNTDKTIWRDSYVSGDLEVETGAALSVNNNLTVNGDSICNGDIVITGDNVKSVWLELRGAVALNGSVTVNGGMLELWNDGSAALNGDITVNGGELYLSSTDVYLNEGGSITLQSVEREPGVFAGGRLTISSNTSFHQLGGVEAKSGTFISIDGLYEVHGKLTNLGDINTVTPDAAKGRFGELQVMSEGLLTNSAYIDNSGTITVQGGMTPEPGGTLVNELGATISNNSGARFVVNNGGIFINDGTLNGTGKFEDKNSQT